MIKIKPIELLSSPAPTLDVRSPKEYAQGHIPGSHPLPLFSDNERARVGICYKHEGQQAAIKLGLDIVGPKMRSFVEQAEAHGSERLNLYCWRGGMRSESMAWLLERYGFDVQLVEGGYKAFRQQIIHYFQQPLPVYVLTGYTGSGKTKVLHCMASRGVQVIDLEGLANHQGSSFGNQLSNHQPSTEQFQNDLFLAFFRLDQNKPIWVEDESICIGQVSLPENLFDRMSIAPHYVLDMPRRRRIDHLLLDYGKISTEKLSSATQAIRKKLGHQETELALSHLEQGRLREAADIILTYYDRQYHKALERKERKIMGTIDGADKHFDQIAGEIMETACQLN